MLVRGFTAGQKTVENQAGPPGRQHSGQTSAHVRAIEQLKGGQNIFMTLFFSWIKLTGGLKSSQLNIERLFSGLRGLIP